MKAIDPETSLAVLVTSRPELARLFAGLGLDYCCGGQRGLAEACIEASLDIDEVMAQLIQISPNESPDDWAALSPSELVDHLEQVHHAFLRETLPWLEALLSKVISAHGERHPELYEIGMTFSELQADLGPHLLKEEQVLFPMIRELFSSTDTPAFHCGSLRNPIGVMMSEHDRVGELLARINTQTSGFLVPADSCGSYRALYEGLAELEADTHLHVHKENNVLFTAVVAEEAK